MYDQLIPDPGFCKIEKKRGKNLGKKERFFHYPSSKLLHSIQFIEQQKKERLACYGQPLCNSTNALLSAGKCPVPPWQDRRGPCLPAGRKGHNQNDTSFPGSPALSARSFTSSITKPIGLVLFARELPLFSSSPGL
jgi:hypothetical protein